MRPWSVLLIVGLVAGAAALVLALTQLVRQVWTVRIIVRRLRRLSPAGLKHALDVFEDPHVRGYLEKLVAHHGTMDEPGPVERFTFSAIDRRENRYFGWIAGATFALGLTCSIGLPPSAAVWRIASIVLTIVSLVFVVLLERRGRRLRRGFEISSFGLTEVLPDGTVRRLHWGNTLTLRNRRWHRRIEVGPPGGDAIIIPYAVVGFERAVELIFEKGGFQPE